MHRLLRLPAIEYVLLGLALSIVWNGAFTLSLTQHSNFAIGPLGAVAVLSGAALLLQWWVNRSTPGHDPLLLPSTVALAGLGLLVISRVAPNFLARQLVWLLIGLSAVGLIVAIPNQLRWLRRFKYTWLILSLLLLAATLFLGVNPNGAGARLWLRIAGIFVQPSEALRLLMIAFLAAFLSERTPIVLTTSLPMRISMSLANLAPSVLMWLVASAVLFSQQDLGAAVLLLSTFVTMLYLGTGRRRLPLIGMAVLLAAGAIGYQLSARVAQRVDIWLNPWPEAQDRAFQVVQSLIAVANGGLFGQGLGQGSPGYVPAVHTDFPFAMLVEETGLLGGLGVLLLFAVLSLRGWRIARYAPTHYERLLAGGIAASIAIQVFVIVGGNLKLLPLTGVTLPLVSFGGSSLCISLVGLGLLIRVSCNSALNTVVSAGEATSARVVTTGLQPDERHTRAIDIMHHLCAVMFGALALTTGYWSLVQGSNLTARADNPRRVDAELAIARGPILARDGHPLAYSTGNLNTGVYSRTYSMLNLAAAIGYYSTQYGNSGIEAAADQRLRGHLSPVDQWLHRPQIGRPVTTTLDVALQAQLAQTLAGHTGAAIISDWHTGEVLALVSSPAFDAGQLDDQWDRLSTDRRAPLLNRVTQGLYQPGRLLTALHQWAFNTPLTTDNYPELAQFKLGQQVPFELSNETTALPTQPVYSDTIGQGQLRLTPLRVNATVAALMAEAPLTFTLLAQPGRSAQPLASIGRVPRAFNFQDTTDNGLGRTVTWQIRVEGDHVITMVIEHDAKGAGLNHGTLPNAVKNSNFAETLARNMVTPAQAEV